MKKLYNTLKHDISAVAAVEFAILLPIMLLLFFGSFEVSRFIMASRKADSIANDIGYLLSREADIYDINKNNPPGSAGEGAERITDIVQSVVPMMLHPFPNKNYEIEIRYIGFPTNAMVDANGDGSDDNNINREDLRIMWAHCDKMLNSPDGSLENDCRSSAGAKVTDQKTAEVHSDASENIGGTTYKTSTYFDEPGRQRAKITLEGQSFILVNFAYGYDQVIRNFKKFVGVDFNNMNLEKLSTYAVRSRWIDENNDKQIQASEFKNNMHICTDCNIFQSDKLRGGTGREPCEKVLTDDDVTSGCKFSK